MLLALGAVVFSNPCPSTGAAQVCEIRIDIAARRGTWSEESVQVGRDVGTSTTFVTLRASVVSICWVSVLDKAVTVEVEVLQTKDIEILLGRAV